MLKETENDNAAIQKNRGRLKNIKTTTSQLRFDSYSFLIFHLY